MGQDIHMYMEYRRRADSAWRMIKRGDCTRCGGDGSVIQDQTNRDVPTVDEVVECWRCEGRGYTTLTYHQDDGGYYNGGECYQGRNYFLFGALAPSGRRSKPPLIEDRGLPHDLTEDVGALYDQWGADAHTTSWLDFEDLTAVMVHEVGTPPGDAMVPEEGDHMSSFYQQVFTKMQQIAAKQGPNNVRIVFWYDN